MELGDAAGGGGGGDGTSRAVLAGDAIFLWPTLAAALQPPPIPFPTQDT